MDKPAVGRIEELRHLAEMFRSAVLRTGANELPGFMGSVVKSFPRGVCGIISPLLGRFLQDEGYTDVQYVSGTRAGDGQSHAWVEVEGIIVDITPDQFPDISAPIVVTVDRGWHLQFSNEMNRSSVDLSQYGDVGLFYEVAYREIVRHVELPPSSPGPTRE